MNSRAALRATKRLILLACLALVWAGSIGGRLVHLQVYRHEAYRKLAEQQQKKLIELRAPRGMILDRFERTLAMSQTVDSVCINPSRAPEVSVASGILAPILALDRRQLRRRMEWALANGRGFLWVKRKISPEESERLRSLRLDWIEFRKESKRSYPKGPIGSHVVGSVDHEEKGNAGVEQTLDAELRGRAGLAQVLTDVRRRGIASQVSTEAVPGKNVTLTIDERIQFVAERELKRAAKTHDCPTGSLVAMNPHTGEILALASFPSFDASVPAQSEEDLNKRENQAISVPFEPGSVFKVITVAAALETTRLHPESMISCGNGRINLFGRLIRDYKAHDEMTLADVLAYSSNVGAIQIGIEVGEARLLDYIRRFGFGKETEIPLPGESAGQVRDLRDWGKTSIGSVAMGHEISATTLQLVQAGSVIANGGLLVRPRLVLRRQRPGEPFEESAVETRHRVIRPETAIALRQMMEGVVLKGTGKLARLDGYTAGGKTGSAQIFDPEIGRYTHRYNASFMGFAPVANPAIVVAVTLNGASKFGGAVAAPVFREVAMAALRLLDVPKDLPETPPLREDEPVDFSDLAIADLGPSAPLLPEPRVPVPKDILEVWGPRVPDFSGKTMRAVLEQSSARGLPVELSGSGIARAQAPAAGSILRRGERVRIQFAR